MRILWLSGVTWCLAASVGGCRDKAEPARVVINGQTWFVDLATTREQRRTGLGGRSNLNDNVGMLFIYPRPEVLQFCMRGCLVSLDIAFIDADKRVVKIHTMPAEEDMIGRVTYSSESPAQYALETAAGSLARAGVRVGDLVTFVGDIPDATKAEDGP